MDGTTSFPNSSGERSGVYLITSRVTGRSYAGSSARVFRRFQYHRKLLRRGIHRISALQEEWDRYGPENFSFEILHESKDRSDRLLAEQQLIDYLTEKESAFNILLHANVKGSKHSPSSIEKMRTWVPSAETRMKMSAAKKGKPTTSSKSASAREKISASKRGSRHPRAKLNEEKVLEMKKYLREGKAVTEIARRFLISPSVVSEIKNEKAWSHVRI